MRTLLISRPRAARLPPHVVAAATVLILASVSAPASASASASAPPPAAGAGLLAWFAASDTHLGHDVGPPNGTVVTSLTKNTWAIAEMNSLPGGGANSTWPESLGGGPVAAPFGVTISGDLIDSADSPGTAVNGCHQWSNFTALYGLDGSDGLLRYRVYEGRGNHDGQNSSSPLPNDCATVPARAVAARNVLRLADKGFRLDNVSAPTGLHYSFTQNISSECSIHFVHLNLFAGHQCGSPANPGREGSTPGGFPCTDSWCWPEDSLGYLEQDLASFASAASGVMVAVIQHYALDEWSNTWWNSDQRAELFATLGRYRTLAAFVGHTHGAALYSFNGTAEGSFGDPRPGFISIVNAPATQKESSDKSALPSEFLAVEASVDASGAGSFRVAQRVGQTWGNVLGRTAFRCY